MPPNKPCAIDCTQQHACSEPGRAFVLAASCTPRRSTKSERREAIRLSSRIPYVARHNDVCGVQPRRDRASVLFDKQMAVLSARVCVGARLQGVRGACMLSARPRNTCLGWRVPGAAAGMLSGWLALSRVGFFFRGRQDGCLCRYNARGLG